ncbi:adenosine deaminase/editase [Mycena pura]|uniref:Adenosine deaminase/editase n=1 Tax=Mycena pura TaxID=153505 RepID=A0AAD7E520_9AGAR|nr:adenosine deaminase/editase [Mycena pura]
MDDCLQVDLVASILTLYDTLPFQPQPRQYTVLASFSLVSRASSKIVSVATGTKCLPANKLPADGEALHDSHAEVLARRGAVRWFLQEVQRSTDTTNTVQSEWLHRCPDGKYALKPHARLVLYVSTVPCGDASMRFLAASQDAQMAALKDASVTLRAPADPSAAARGRDNYALWGVLRTKPARADAPTTASMSCSDKIAAWSFLGIQGALGAKFLHPLYIDSMIIGEVPAELRHVIREDCERALWRRIEDCGPYSLHKPPIHFTDIPFVHSRSMIQDVGGSCNDSICWVADSTKPAEIIINGFKRGVPPKNRHREQSRPETCRKSMLQLYHETLHACGLPQAPDVATLRDIKHSAGDYHVAKDSLIGGGGLFCGWIRGSTIDFDTLTPRAHKLH